MTIDNGDKVQYIGDASPSYLEVNKRNKQEGRKGTVVSDPYQLSTASDVYYVDVVWFYESIPKGAFLNHKMGHVVNVKNLKKI